MELIIFLAHLLLLLVVYIKLSALAEEATELIDRAKTANFQNAMLLDDLRAAIEEVKK